MQRFMRWACAAMVVSLWLCLLPGAEAKVLTESDVDQDNEKELILENKFCKLALKPSLGKGISLIVKPSNTDLLRDEAGRRCSLLGDYFEQQGNGGDFTDKPYSIEVIANTDEKASVRLSRVGSTDLLRWITVAKTITMYAGRAAIDVTYEISNEAASMEDYHLGLGIVNVFNVGEEITLSVPLANGVLQKVLNPQTPGGTDQSYDNISRGWGSVALESGKGVAFHMEYAGLKRFYEWHKATVRTFEWVYRSPKIEQGKSLRTTFQIIPFEGMAKVDGVVKGYAGNIGVEGVLDSGKKTPIRVRLCGGGGETPKARISVRQLPDGKENVLGDVPAVAEKDGIFSAQADFTPDREAVYVIRVVVAQGAETLGEFERPVKVGQASASYALKPLTARTEESKEAMARKIPNPSAKGAAAKAAPSIQDVPPDIELSDEIKTPHIPWANPYYLGKTKVFFVTASPREREVIEIAQRFSMEYFRTTHGVDGYKAPWSLMRTWNASVAAANQKKILKTQPLDVIVTCMPWDNLDPEVQQLILKRVENGTGLVTISPRLQKSGSYGYRYTCALSDEDLKKFPQSLALSLNDSKLGQWKNVKNHFITTGIPLEIMRSNYSVHSVQEGDVLAEVDSEPLIVVGECGKGRVVALNYNVENSGAREHGFIPNLYPYLRDGKFEPNPDYPTYRWWEYSWSLLIKSALWASNREPELLIDNINVSGGSQDVMLLLDNTREQGTFTFDVTIRNAYSTPVFQKSYAQPVAKGKSKVTLAVDPAVLSGGLQFADVIIRADGLVVNWGTALLRKPQPVTLSAVKLDKEFLNADEPLRASITLSNPLARNDGLQLWAMIHDVRGRLLEELPVNGPEGANTIQAQWPTTKIQTIAFFLVVQLRKGEQVVDEKRVRGILAQQREWDDYISCVEMGIGFHGYYVPYWIKEFAKHGGNMIQTRLHGNSNFTECLESDMKIADGSRFIDDFGYNSSGKKEEEYKETKANYFRTKDLKFLERNPCFNNPAYRAQTLNTIQKVVGFMQRCGKMDYLLTDELSMTNYGDSYDFCFCEHCRTAFREWVKPQYRDLNELNDAYGMHFATWNEVRMVTALEAREKGKWAGWADHRAFNEYSMHAFFKWMRAEARKIQPDATINLSGTQSPNPYNGHDVWLRSQTFDNLWAYGVGQQTRMQRSFNPQLKQMPWGGYGSSGPAMHHKIWDNVFQGGHGNAFYWFPIYMNPDFRLNPCSQAWMDATRDLLNGIGRTIFTTEFDDGGIGIHYSQPSIHAAYILDANSSFDADRAAWTEQVIEGSQYQARFLAYAQLERGDLTYPRTKVLILPYSIALSDKEAAAIREFVRSGGTVIADMQTGIMDQHCRSLTKGAIDDVLGIKRGSAEIRPIMGDIKWNPIQGWDFTPKDLGIQLQEPGIAVTTGQALVSVGSTPGLVMNSFGKGRAWYLNFSLAKFDLLRKKEQHREIVTLVNRILGMGGVQRYASLVDEKGQLVESCRVFSYHKDPMHFVGLLPDISFGEGVSSVAARLKIPAGCQLVDMRKGAPADPDKITLQPGMAHLYALLPYSVTEVVVTAPASVRQGENVDIGLTVKADRGEVGDHVVRIETQDPSGETIRYYSENLVSAKGVASYKIALPLNAAPGVWRITALDVPSGRRQSVAVQVEPGKRLSPAGALLLSSATPAVPKAQAKLSGAWGETQRPPRETFTPESKELSFNLEGSILKNPSLKLGANTGGLPAQWEATLQFIDLKAGTVAPVPSMSAVRFEEDSTVPFMGKPSIKITVGPSEKTMYLELQQSIMMSDRDLRGKKLRLTCYACREKPPEREFSIVAPLTSKGPDGKPESKYSVFNLTPVIPPGTWVRLFAEGTVHPETDSFRLSLRSIFTAEDTFWLSGFLLEVIP